MDNSYNSAGGTPYYDQRNNQSQSHTRPPGLYQFSGQLPPPPDPNAGAPGYTHRYQPPINHSFPFRVEGYHPPNPFTANRGAHSGMDHVHPSRSAFVFQGQQHGGGNQNGAYSQRVGSSRDARVGHGGRPGRGGNNRARGGRGNRGRGFRRFAPTSQRPLLVGGRDKTPELLEGMDGTAKFMRWEDASDNSGAEMDLESEDNKDDDIPPPKKVKIVDENTTKQWSNPDPYFLPPEEPRGKGKEVLKAIRKAKAPDATHNTMAADASDFISFGFGDDNVQSSSSDGEVSEALPVMTRAAEGGREVANIVNLTLNDDVNNDYSPPPVPSDVRNALQIAAVAALPPQAPQGPFPRVGSAVGVDVWPPPPPSGPHPDVIPPPPADEENMEGINIENIISDGQRTRGKTIDFDKTTAPAGTKFVKRTGPMEPETAKGKNSKKRKRSTIDEQIPAVSRAISTAWKVTPHEDGMPWVLPDLARTASAKFRLHKEICQFFDFVRPRDYEDSVRHQLVDRVQMFLNGSEFKQCRAEVSHFGSFAAGIYLPDADMDLVVRSHDFRQGGYPQIGQGNFLFKFGKALVRAGIAKHGSLVTIPKAKVPLVKYTDNLTGLKVDVSFENNTGLWAVETYADWKKQYPAMPIIVTLVKHFLLMRTLNDVSIGGLGGFSVTCLVVSMLQLLPQVQSNNMNPMEHLGEVLLEFFDYYGNHFNCHETLIELNPPRLSEKAYSKVPRKIDRLAIIDPNRADNDISGGSHNIHAIFAFFSQAFSILKQRMYDVDHGLVDDKYHTSVLAVLFRGNYENFESQRTKLFQLSRGLPSYE